MAANLAVRQHDLRAHPASGWELFPHDADVGLRGFGSTPAEAFEQAACALTAVVTDPRAVAPQQEVEIACQAQGYDFLLLEWLNSLVYEMAIRRMLFSRFVVHIEQDHLRGWAWGEAVDPDRHEPAAEVKGATLTALEVSRRPGGGWIAQCVVDV